MDQDLIFPERSSRDDNHVHDLADSKGHFVLGRLQILPVKVVVLDSGIHQNFRCVRKPSSRNDSISAEWVFSWFLQIKHCCDPEGLELLQNFELNNESVAKALRSDDKPQNPFTVETHNCRVAAVSPILMFAPLSKTSDGAVDPSNLLKIACLKFTWRLAWVFWYLHGSLFVW